ncbi:N-acetyltransferase [Acinetobacter chinensis]|jgi:RimJ/RimL family protein N-acetyltransferase|uniref:N-acetyltransferase n=1 Tax=Acinetobacter chinensis TaxID=2004650 RepID=A0A3B7LZP8_9GAMM|nr:GNAT family N-acetyltransferase [Acinetobacter chinensis]AXY55793.1 N-acetyltransferase [Acinetobacter chinensis]
MEIEFDQLRAGTVHFRLVEEEDAAFICGLRNNPVLNKHISQSSAVVDEQRAWIKTYKNRENLGQEYYFIICRNDNNLPVGTIRLYDFQLNPKKSFCWGSWILNENKPRFAAIESALLVYKFAFEQLKFEQSHFDVRKENTGVHNFHMRLGAQHIDGNELDNFYIYPSSKYYEILNEYQKFLG